MIHVIHLFIYPDSWLVDQFFIHLKVGTKKNENHWFSISNYLNFFNVLYALENTEGDAINSLPLFHEKGHGDYLQS